MGIKTQKFSVPYSTMLKNIYGAKDDDEENVTIANEHRVRWQLQLKTRRMLEHAKEKSHNNCITWW